LEGVDPKLDDKAHTLWARENRGSGECAYFYIDFDTGKPYPCSCGYVESLEPEKTAGGDCGCE
jgi:hypothetical protein